MQYHTPWSLDALITSDSRAVVLGHDGRGRGPMDVSRMGGGGEGGLLNSRSGSIEAASTSSGGWREGRVDRKRERERESDGTMEGDNMGQTIRY